MYAAGRVWVITGKNGDKLIGIDSTSVKPTRPVALGRHCADLGGGSGSVVWVIRRDANQILRFDPRKRVVRGPPPEHMRAVAGWLRSLFSDLTMTVEAVIASSPRGFARKGRMTGS